MLHDKTIFHDSEVERAECFELDRSLLQTRMIYGLLDIWSWDSYLISLIWFPKLWYYGLVHRMK